MSHNMALVFTEVEENQTLLDVEKSVDKLFEKHMLFCDPGSCGEYRDDTDDPCDGCDHNTGICDYYDIETGRFRHELLIMSCGTSVHNRYLENDYSLTIEQIEEFPILRRIEDMVADPEEGMYLKTTVYLNRNIIDCIKSNNGRIDNIYQNFKSDDWAVLEDDEIDKLYKYKNKKYAVTIVDYHY